LVVLNISKEQIERARKLYKFGTLKGSITKGKSNIYGSIGEIIVYDYFKDSKNIEFESTYDYDMIIDGYTVDVKTKKTTVSPQPHYLCGIPAYNTKQKCQFYFFVRVLEDLSRGFILGYITKDNFFKLAKFRRQGDRDTNGFIFKDDCYNLKISDLIKFT